VPPAILSLCFVLPCFTYVYVNMLQCNPDTPRQGQRLIICCISCGHTEEVDHTVFDSSPVSTLSQTNKLKRASSSSPYHEDGLFILAAGQNRDGACMSRTLDCIQWAKEGLVGRDRGGSAEFDTPVMCPGRLILGQ